MEDELKEKPAKQNNASQVDFRNWMSRKIRNALILLLIAYFLYLVVLRSVLIISALFSMFGTIAMPLLAASAITFVILFHFLIAINFPRLFFFVFVMELYVFIFMEVLEPARKLFADWVDLIWELVSASG